MQATFPSVPQNATNDFSTTTPLLGTFVSWMKSTYIRAQVESDMTVKPYESEADREARRKAEEEKRRREEEAKGSNDKFRALDVSRPQGMRGCGQAGWGRCSLDSTKPPATSTQWAVGAPTFQMFVLTCNARLITKSLPSKNERVVSFSLRLVLRAAPSRLVIRT